MTKTGKNRAFGEFMGKTTSNISLILLNHDTCVKLREWFFVNGIVPTKNLFQFSKIHLQLFRRRAEIQ
jgi:hypothetical protein